jgi:hypothetical protein
MFAEPRSFAHHVLVQFPSRTKPWRTHTPAGAFLSGEGTPSAHVLDYLGKMVVIIGDSIVIAIDPTAKIENAGPA